MRLPLLPLALPSLLAPASAQLGTAPRNISSDSTQMSYVSTWPSITSDGVYDAYLNLLRLRERRTVGEGCGLRPDLDPSCSLICKILSLFDLKSSTDESKLRCLLGLCAVGHELSSFKTSVARRRRRGPFTRTDSSVHLSQRDSNFISLL